MVLELLSKLLPPLLVISITITLFISTATKKPLTGRLGVAVYSQLMIMLVFNMMNVLYTMTNAGQFISVTLGILYITSFILCIIGLLRTRKAIPTKKTDETSTGDETI